MSDDKESASAECDADATARSSMLVFDLVETEIAARDQRHQGLIDLLWNPDSDSDAARAYLGLPARRGLVQGVVDKAKDEATGGVFTLRRDARGHLVDDRADDSPHPAEMSGAAEYRQIFGGRR